MSLKSAFTSFAHAIAAGSKYFAIGLSDAIKVASKVSVIQPEADLLIAAVAGPQAVKAADLGFYALGQVAEALKPLNADQTAAVAAKGLNIKLDTATVNDVKSLVAVIEAMLAARGTPAPPAAAAPTS